MRIWARILIGFFLLLALVAYALLTAVFEELKPAFSRATEETLVDTASLLAEVLAGDATPGASPSLRAALDRFAAGTLEARIYHVTRSKPGLHVYVTDHRGTVVYDSAGAAVGEDYSRWNDVYLTLRGRYGARATRRDPDDELTSTYYVAAPIRHANAIVGVVSVGKAAESLLPYLQASERRIALTAMTLVAAAVVLGAVLAGWITRNIRRLTAYADAVSQGQSADPPRVGEPELATLGRAMTRMREELQSKDYVEETVHALTHELKSPLAAIRGAVEILRGDPDTAARARFLDNIEIEGARLQQVVDRMLLLATVEQRDALTERKPVDLAAVIRRAVESRRPRLQESGIGVAEAVPGSLVIQGDAFLLDQAVGNLLDNAIDFSPTGACIDVALTGNDALATVSVADCGPGIPSYAHSRIFERFYSLPRPATGQKSTGLGLSFVREVARLHQGTVTVANRPEGGAAATLQLAHR